MPYAITGPYKYAEDTHPSFRVASDDKIIATFYVPDGKEDEARARAELYVFWQNAEDNSSQARRR